MDQPAVSSPRLLALRLHGFKSFAERTVVEFGGGISAVVGPNGSGKSNLADALRWAMGEQGRALRSRKAEDVIWAGSDRRAAQGMADVTLVIDNADGLLPVDYQVLELGRRLYRSGENDYLLNKQRIRLRDLVDLLDAAHLADNAFLFIGQGMVDQALALRPDERRPLFEEVAGVRRHERRRRKADEKLTEAEANLARVEDILAELRPQARRMSVQAEQQATRETAGDELADGLITTGHAKWYVAAGRLGDATAQRGRARLDADRAMAALAEAEHAAASTATELGARAALERERRTEHETIRAAGTELRLRDGRLASDLEATERDRRRLAEERAAAEADLAVQRSLLAEPIPPVDHDLDAALGEADRALAEALAELGGLRAARHARGEEMASIRRAQQARAAEAETARRRLAEAERRSADEATRVTDLTVRRSDLEVRVVDARAALDAAIAAERSAAIEREASRNRSDEAEGLERVAAERAAAAGSAHAALRARLEGLSARLAEDEARGIARAAVRRGGRRLDVDLSIDPLLQPAVEAVLSAAAQAYLVGSSSVAALSSERGMVLVEERVAGEDAPDARGVRLRARVMALGGGSLADAIRRDPTAAVRRILGRAVWLPDLSACLDVQPLLPPGWAAVPRDGSAVVTDLAVTLGPPDGSLERRAEATRLTADLARAATEHESDRAAADGARVSSAAARAALEAARTTETRAVSVRRGAEEADRDATRGLEALVREAAWHEAQATRADAEVARLRAAAALLTEVEDPAGSPAGTTDDEGGALATWEARAHDLRARRDRIAGQVAETELARRTAEGRRARAEAAVAMDEDRISRTEREMASLVVRARTIAEDRDALHGEIGLLAARENGARETLAELDAADTSDRARLAEQERAAASSRERLRAADERVRAADHAELEARLGLDALREQLLVELASMADVGRERLLESAGAGGAASDDADTTDADTTDADTTGTTSIESALALAAPAWAASPPATDPPSPSRLAALRRRYHELGAANPYAVEEYAELKARLESLETQRTDLVAAIAQTRDLIDELRTMVAEEFRATFRKLESAFAARFVQLFGGGEARLALTDPTDLASTGVDIVARPPGKKAQALAMLSGGERALTAVALLFAMLEVRPVPFCVLDEVDAALDEANIGRFADALRSLADRTQFIVITHNRGTIEAADAMYGVTVGDDSVSRVISLRLDDAREIAANRRGELAPAG